MSENLDRPWATWRGLWTPRRARIWLATAAFAAWLPIVGMPLRGWLDFSAFYAAGALAFRPEVLDLGAIGTFQAIRDLPNTPFLYPPALAIAYVPLAQLPYDVAAAIHLGIQAIALLGAAVLAGPVFGIERRWAIIGTLAWAPAAAAVLSGQNSAVLLLLIVAATVGLVRPGQPGRPNGHLLAGIAIGLAAYRPHLGLPLAGLALWRRVWHPFAMAAVVIVAQYGLGVLATGGSLDWPVTWLSAIGTETAHAIRSVGWQAIGLPGNLGRLSVGGGEPGSLLGPAGIGYAIGFVVILSALGPLWRWDVRRAVALTCALALFAGPRGFAYDGTMLLPAIAVVARDAMDRGWRWQDRWLLAAAYALAIAWPVSGIIGLNPLALVVLAAPFVLLGRWPFRTFRPPDGRALGVGILGRP